MKCVAKVARLGMLAPGSRDKALGVSGGFIDLAVALSELGSEARDHPAWSVARVRLHSSPAVLYPSWPLFTSIYKRLR